METTENRILTLWGTDCNSMINMNQRVRLLSGTRAQCEHRRDFYIAHPEYAYSDLRIS